MDVEAEDLGGKGMLLGEVLGAPDALLPDCGGHRVIMGLSLAAGKCNRFTTESQRHRENQEEMERRNKNPGISLCLGASVVKVFRLDVAGEAYSVLSIDSGCRVGL